MEVIAAKVTCCKTTAATELPIEPAINTVSAVLHQAEVLEGADWGIVLIWALLEIWLHQTNSIFPVSKKVLKKYWIYCVDADRSLPVLAKMRHGFFAWVEAVRYVA